MESSIMGGDELMKLQKPNKMLETLEVVYESHESHESSKLGVTKLGVINLVAIVCPCETQDFEQAASRD